QLGVRLFRHHGLALFDPTGQVFVLAILLNDLRDLAVGLGGLLVARRIADHLWRRERPGEFVVFGFDLVQSLEHLYCRSAPHRRRSMFASQFWRLLLRLARRASRPRQPYSTISL